MNEDEAFEELGQKLARKPVSEQAASTPRTFGSEPRGCPTPGACSCPAVPPVGGEAGEIVGELRAAKYDNRPLALKAAALIEAQARELREIKEWVCEHCNHVFPQSPTVGFNLRCPRCAKGTVMPLALLRARRAESERDELRRRLEAPCEEVEKQIVAWKFRRGHGSGLSFAKPEEYLDEDNQLKKPVALVPANYASDLYRKWKEAQEVLDEQNCPRKYVQVGGTGTTYCLYGTSSISAFEAAEHRAAEAQREHEAYCLRIATQHDKQLAEAVAREREACAVVCQEMWQRSSALYESKVAGELMRRIRARSEGGENG